MIAQDTVEEKVLDMQNRKRTIANAVLANGPDDLDTLPPMLTAEQLRELLIG